MSSYLSITTGSSVRRRVYRLNIDNVRCPEIRAISVVPSLSMLHFCCTRAALGYCFVHLATLTTTLETSS